MTRVLVTAYEPYDRWPENASWLALVELTQALPSEPEVVTRRYPVDFDEVRTRLERDHQQVHFDFAIHMGQAPGYGRLHLEAVGLNIGIDRAKGIDSFPLSVEGPEAYRSVLPLEDWSDLLNDAGIPSHVSYHAGTYLCNAALYWSHHFAAQQGRGTRAVFLHLPLDVTQAAAEPHDCPSLAASESARAVRLLLEQCAALHAAELEETQDT